MTAFLVIADGRRIAAENGLTIGRSPDCGLVLADTKASRHHARILVEGGVAEIEDLGSSNGTLLNGKPVERRVLRHGDTLQIGTTLLTFEEGASVAPPAGQPAQSPAASRRIAEDDDVDLFAGEPEPTADEASGQEARHEPPGRPTAPPAGQAVPPSPAPTAPPKADEPPSRPPPTPGPETGPPAAGAPPPRPVDVVEFEDEVVEVRRAARSPSKGPAAASGGLSGEATVQHKPGALHYSRHTRESAGAGMMRDDLAQMPGWQRNLLVLLAVAAAAGLGYLAMVLARG